MRLNFAGRKFGPPEPIGEEEAHRSLVGAAGIRNIRLVYGRRPIPGISGHPDRPIYIGSSTNLAQREFETHFRSTATGFSTIRRTLGALLKERLGLVARPRGQGKTKQDFYCYRFELDGEDRLTDWMTGNIHVAVQPISDYISAERELTATAQPPLNLTGWANPDASEIKRRRKVCADEARRVANRFHADI